MSPRQLGLDDVERGLKLLVAAPPIRQELPAPVALALLSYLQLALRHPSAQRGAAARLVREAAVQLGEALVARVPELRDLVAAGWDPGQDVPS